MLNRYFGLMRWWIRKWYPVFRYVGRLTGEEEYVERAVDMTEDNLERILGGDNE